MAEESTVREQQSQEDSLEAMRIARNGDRTLETAVEHMSPFERKNLLLSFARQDQKKSAATLLDAGRGNPNWIAAKPREAFFLLGQFAMKEARLAMRVPGVDIAGMPPKSGSATRFRQFLESEAAADPTNPGIEFLTNCLAYAQAHQFDLDDFVHEWTEGITGCEYPVPERILKNTQQIIRQYLIKEICGNKEPSDPAHPLPAESRSTIPNAPLTPGHTFDLFATEGGTAAMCYMFYALKSNFLIHEGDTMALMTPIFTPYIEIPQLNDYHLNVVNINASSTDADGDHTWQYPQEELNKLADPKVKLVCIVNPSNPPSYAMSDESRQALIDIVHTKNPNLMIITDDVYGTFVPGYRSLFADLPYNTASIYSFSKYFGATGWRLAVTAVAKHNIFDDLIAALPANHKKVLASRYSSLGDDIPAIAFIDRMVADSRLVALNGTAGLGTPQQIQMDLFALQELMDEGGLYHTKMLELVKDRYDCLWNSLGLDIRQDPLRADYYSIVDIDRWARKAYGDDFATWLEKNYNPLDFVFRLAKDTGIVVMDGGGFDAPRWSIRVSLANLQIDDYQRIGEYVHELLAEYAEVYKTRRAE